MRITLREIEQLARRIASLSGARRIVLFGSAARGQQSPESDVDLLVVIPEGEHRRQTARNLYRQLRQVGFPFDLVVATESDLRAHGAKPGLIYQTILREGRTVYAA